MKDQEIERVLDEAYSKQKLKRAGREEKWRPVHSRWRTVNEWLAALHRRPGFRVVLITEALQGRKPVASCVITEIPTGEQWKATGDRAITVLLAAIAALNRAKRKKGKKS